MNQFGLFGGKEIEIVLCYPFQFNMECGGLTLLGVLSWSGPTVASLLSPFKPGHGRKLCPVPQSVVNNPGARGGPSLLLLGILEFRLALILKKSLVQNQL